MKIIPITPLVSALFAGVAMVAVLYTGARGLDAIFGQPRSGGQFGRNRATRVEQGLINIGKLIGLSASALLIVNYV